jgi:crotonobetainyl-CoA:carnitine CoA-transferase CaiB-like acyl-CoA transferase
LTSLLDGLRVLDLSLWQPGHTATQLLADVGADVVKVEPPGGDRMRPLVDRFVNYNGWKRSIVLDLKDNGDRARFLGLAADAEVVVENYRPGVAARLGVAFDDLKVVNPAIVLCSISGFGQFGPLAGSTGHDANYQAYAGAFTINEGGEPAPSTMLVGDQGSGLVAAFAILAAVLCARRTGDGEHIDVSIADLLASWVAPMAPVDARRVGGGGGGRDGVAGVDLDEDSDGFGIGAPGMGTFKTSDGRYVVLGVFSEDHFWDELCRTLGLDQDIGLNMAERQRSAPALRGELVAAIASWPRDPLIAALASRSVPAAPILTRAEMLEHPHFRERGVITTGPDGYRSVGHPVSYRVHPARPPGRPPDLDEHRTAILEG